MHALSLERTSSLKNAVCIDLCSLPGFVLHLSVTHAIQSCQSWCSVATVLLDLTGVKEYSTAIDMWSVGCIMGELILNAPLLSGKSEMEQIHKIFSLVGTPTKQNWPKHTELPNLNRVRLYSVL